MRTDFRVTSDADVKEFDLTIISITSVEARGTSATTRNRLNNSAETPLSPSTVASTSLQSILASGARDKISKYRQPSARLLDRRCDGELGDRDSTRLARGAGSV
jgi:hypothetical protein